MGKIKAKIREIRQLYSIRFVHFMDDFGPSVYWLKNDNPFIKFSTTAITYNVANYPKLLYRIYKQFSLLCNDMVFFTADDFSRLIKQNSWRAANYKEIPWGVSCGDQIRSFRHRNSALRYLGFAPENSPLILLWSGFLQQIKEQEFLKSYDLARNLAAKRKDLLFIFCLKPENYKDEFQFWQLPHLRILSTKVAEFQMWRDLSDLFFSPLWGKPCIGGPPLTWIECMAQGLPVVTTRETGVEKIIKEGETGFLFSTPEEFESILKKAANSKYVEKMGQTAQRFVKENFNIVNIAEQYAAAWGVDRSHGSHGSL
jgi:glycosyltransferase involved in cell wall biosynthesis